MPDTQPPEPAAPVADEDAAAELRRLCSHTIRVYREIESLRDETARLRRQMHFRTGWGVFLGLWLFALTFLLLLWLLGRLPL